MSSTLSPQKAPAPRPTGRPSPDLSPVEFVKAIYRFLHNKRVGLVLILAMALLTLLGVLFPQAPSAVQADPEAFSAWLEELRPRYRGWTDPLAWLGVFGIFSSWWSRATTLLLAISILACTSHRVPLLWRQATKPRLHVGPHFFEHGRLHEQVQVEGSIDEASQRVRSTLAHEGFRVIPDPDGGNHSFYADRFRWAPFGTVAAHLAFDLILVGVLITSMAGFRVDSMPLIVGTDPVAVGHDTGLTVAARSFSDSYDEMGRPLDYASELVVYRGGEQVAAQTVRVNEPLGFDGVSFNQASFGAAVELTVRDGDRDLFAGGIPLVYSSEDGSQVFGSTELAGGDLELYALTPASGQVDPEIGPGQMLVQIYAAGQDEPLGTEILDQGRPTDVAGLQVTFERERQYTGLMVSRDPGAPWVWTGAVLLILGSFFTMFLRHRRMWVRVEEAPQGATVLLVSPDRPDLAFRAKFDQIVRKVASS